MIEKSKKVSLEYTVFLEDGTMIDTNVGEDPLVFVLPGAALAIQDPEGGVFLFG